MILTNAILITLACIALKYYTNLDNIFIIITALIGFVIMSLVNTGSFDGKEGFGSEYKREVNYGDIVTLWSWKNKYISASDDSKTITLSPVLTQPSEIPRRWTKEYYVIEDSLDPAGPGNSGSIKFGDKVFLRSWKYTYLGADEKGNIIQTKNRSAYEQFEIVSLKIAGKNGSSINYGDALKLKTWRSTYIGYDTTDDTCKQLSEAIKSTNSSEDIKKMISFRIYDQYGQGNVTDWARRGTATQ